MRRRDAAGLVGCARSLIWRCAGRRWPAGRAGADELAVGASAAPAAGARRQVPALRVQDAVERPAGDRGVAPRAAGGQPAADRARRGRAGSGEQARRGRARGARCSTRGRRRRARSRSPTRSTRSAARSGTGAGARPERSSQAVVMKDSLGVGLDLVSDLAAASGVRDRRDRSPAPADRSRGCRSATTIRTTSPNAVFDRLVYGLHPYGRPQSGTPETHRRDHARRSASRSTASGSAPTTPSSRSSATSRPRRRSPAPSARSAAWARSAASADAMKSADPPAPARRVIVDRQAGRGPDRDPRRQPRDCRASTTTIMALDLADRRSSAAKARNRLHRVLRSERGLTYGASADFNALKQPATSSRRPTRDPRRPARRCG